MHELSIALSLVESATEELGRLRDVRARAVHLELGALSGVVEDALRFSFDLVVEGTPLAGAALVVRDVPVTVRCRCDGEPQPVRSIWDLRCARCGAPATDLATGREIRLAGLEVEDVVDAHR